MLRLINGERVVVPPPAMIARPFAVDGKFRHLLVSEVAALEPFEPGEDPITTVKFDDGQMVGANVVRLTEEEMPRWGIHRFHKAKDPQLSPFIELPRADPRTLTDRFTFEVVRQGGRYLLTRAYPGDYSPPLPWMTSAVNADGGVQACQDYWDEHAYLALASVLRGDLSDEAPDWAL